MAPRRNTMTAPSALDVQNLFGLKDESFGDFHALDEPNMVRCCVPNTECLRSSDFGLINLDDLTDCIRVSCSNEACSSGTFMHRECFEAWELTVLNYMKTLSRAKAWSDKQRQQHLWTKKGFELVFKACNCKCGRGHLKKDVDWIPPTPNSLFNEDDKGITSVQKKKKRNRTKLSLIEQQSGNKNILDLSGLLETTSIRPRVNSISSSNGSSSPPVSSSEQSVSPVHSTNNNNLVTNSVTGKNPTRPLTPKSMVELYSERVRLVN